MFDSYKVIFEWFCSATLTVILVLFIVASVMRSGRNTALDNMVRLTTPEVLLNGLVESAPNSLSPPSSLYRAALQTYWILNARIARPLADMVMYTNTADPRTIPLTSQYLTPTNNIQYSASGSPPVQLPLQALNSTFVSLVQSCSLKQGLCAEELVDGSSFLMYTGLSVGGSFMSVAVLSS